MNQKQKTKVSEFNRTLFTWQKKSYREMPWRPKTFDARVRLKPYNVLVSELMLQQTQVARVREKYVQFLKKFPTVKKLADAPLGEVLKLWSGLGYNRRAKYLHLLAKELMDNYRGKFPTKFEELVKLPGIGISTAGALLAFSFAEDVPMIDTNIRRILSRVFFKHKKIPSDKELFEFGKMIIPKGKGRMWNYAMLDIGATQCTARAHNNDCPLMKLHGKVADFAYKKPQKKFAGSERFYRGKILRLLAREDRATKTDITLDLKGYSGKLNELLLKLHNEGMIAKYGQYYRLPG